MIGGCEGPAEQVKQTCFVIDAQRSAAPGLARGILGDGHVAGPRARCKRNGIADPAAIVERRVFGEVSGYTCRKNAKKLDRYYGGIAHQFLSVPAGLGVMLGCKFFANRKTVV